MDSKETNILGQEIERDPWGTPYIDSYPGGRVEVDPGTLQAPSSD